MCYFYIFHGLGYKSVSPPSPTLNMSYAKHVRIQLIFITAIYWQFITIKREKYAIMALKLIICLAFRGEYSNNTFFRVYVTLKYVHDTNEVVYSWNLRFVLCFAFTIYITHTANRSIQLTPLELMSL